MITKHTILALLLFCGCGGRLHWKDPPEPACASFALPEAKELPVARVAQLTDNWCWAASGEMILNHYQSPRSQCEQATHALGRSCCPPRNCGEPLADPDCDFGSFPMLESYGFDVYARRAPLTMERIKKEIACREAPIAFSWKYDWVVNDGVSQPVGHMAVIVGYAGDQLRIIDPFPLCGTAVEGEVSDVPYEFYLSGGEPEGVHWEDRYAFEKPSNQ